MEIDRFLDLLIACKTDDYKTFLDSNLINFPEYSRLKSALLREPREKYESLEIATIESKIAQGLLDGQNLNNRKNLVIYSQNVKKYHLGIELLRPNKREIEINMYLDELEKLVKNYLDSVSCVNFSQGYCIASCPYNMSWDRLVNCYDPHKKSYDVLKKYAGNPVAKTSMINIIMDN